MTSHISQVAFNPPEDDVICSLSEMTREGKEEIPGEVTDAETGGEAACTADGL